MSVVMEGGPLQSMKELVERIEADVDVDGIEQGCGYT